MHLLAVKDKKNATKLFLCCRIVRNKKKIVLKLCRLCLIDVLQCIFFLS